MGTVLGLTLRGITAQLDGILAFAELDRFARLKLKHYSSGMASRLAYAVAFAAVREVLVLDEIFAVGDAGFRARCEARYGELREAGHTVLMVSHDPRTISTFCDRALLLDGGAADRRGHGRRGRGPLRRVADRHAVTTPTTSFVVTCHNLGAYLDETLDSLFAQTVQDFESWSSTTAPPMARPAACSPTSFARGPASCTSSDAACPARATSASVTRVGRYLCMVDADDVLEPTYLERSLQALESRPDLAFASHWLRAFGDETWDWTPTDCGFPALLHANTLNGAALMRRDGVRARRRLRRDDGRWLRGLGVLDSRGRGRASRA